MIAKGMIWTLLAATLVAGISYWGTTQLPDGGSVPIHWDIDGEADQFVDPATAQRMLWAMPVFIFALGLLLALMAWIDPLRANIRKARGAYLTSWAATMVFATVISGIFVYAMTQQASGPQTMRLVVGSMSALFIVIGNVLPKTRPSFAFGIRTPWTLTSYTSWEKTHRLGGKLIIIAGLIGLISSATLSIGLMNAVFLAAILSAAAISVIYSYFIWRAADDRLSPPDYSGD